MLLTFPERFPRRFGKLAGLSPIVRRFVEFVVEIFGFILDKPFFN